MTIKGENGQVLIPLLKFEESLVIAMEPGITTISFFPKDVDYPMSLSWLKSRVKLICEANPWLVGRILRNKRIHERLLCSFPQSITDDDVDAVFQTECPSFSNVTSKTPYNDLSKAIVNSGAVVKTLRNIVNKDERVAKFTFVQAGEEYAFLYSQSHVAGDGHTYYKILSMVTAGAPIQSLTVERKQVVEKATIEAVGEQEAKFLHAPGVWLNALGSMICGPSCQVTARFVDQAKVEAAKADAQSRQNQGHAGDCSFACSTNDIITSSFAQATRARVLAMAFNLRGRLENFLDIDAGNYETMLFYDRESFATPEAIRQSLHGGPPFKRVSGLLLPAPCEQLRARLAFITSWAFSSFQADLCLLDSSGNQSVPLTLHLPFYDAKEAIPIPNAIVFKPCRGRLAVMYFCPPRDRLDERLEAAGAPLGENVNSAMFD